MTPTVYFGWLPSRRITRSPLPRPPHPSPSAWSSVVTALVTSKRNTLSPTRIVQLGWMRIVMRGRHARVPLWRRKKKAAAVPAAAAAGAGAGAGGGAGAGAGGGALSAMFKAAAPVADDKFEVVEVEDDSIDRDLLLVVLDAVSDDDEELDFGLELALATSGAADDAPADEDE